MPDERLLSSVGEAAALSFSPSRMAQERRNGRKMSVAKDEPDRRLRGHARLTREAPGYLAIRLVLLDMLDICYMDVYYLTLREWIRYT